MKKLLLQIQNPPVCLIPKQPVHVSEAPLTYLNYGGGGGEGGGPSDFFGSEILAKSDFFRSMKDARIFLGRERKTEGFFGVAKKGLRDFLGLQKKD